MQPSETLRSALPLVLFAILAASAAWACFGERGIIVNQALATEIVAREGRVVERRAVIAHLHHAHLFDHLHHARWVREELGFVRPGEVVFVFPSDRDADFDMLSDRSRAPTNPEPPAAPSEADAP